MARMGTQKTFLLTPEDPKVKLPTYFKGIEPLTYQKRADGNYVAGTGGACIKIRDRVHKLRARRVSLRLTGIGISPRLLLQLHLLPIHNTLRETSPCGSLTRMPAGSPSMVLG